MSAVVRALVALLVAVIGLGSASTAEAVQAPTLVTCTYDAPRHVVPPMDGITERGPPAEYDHATYDAGASWSHGAELRSERPGPAADTDFEHSGMLAEVAWAAGTTAREAETTYGCSFVLQRSRVAANTAARACSFAGSTTVLMADGTRQPIEHVEVGEKVIATDPETGEQVAKAVEHVFVHDDTVIDLVVDGEVITTTEDHPFWSVTDQRFERADELSRGEKVLSADGRVITVSGLQLGTAREALAYNLSVEAIHSYHVGDDSILVHNTCSVPLLAGQKDALRAGARDIWQSTTGRRAVWDGLDVHHRIPLEWAHLMPGGPNRLSNLVGMRSGDHTQVTQAWNAWRRGLGGATPTQSQVMQQALTIDRQFGQSMVFPR